MKKAHFLPPSASLTESQENHFHHHTLNSPFLWICASDSSWFSGATFIHPGTGLTHGWHLISLELDRVESVATLAELGVSSSCPQGLVIFFVSSLQELQPRYPASFLLAGVGSTSASMLGSQPLVRDRVVGGESHQDLYTFFFLRGVCATWEI